MKDDNKTNNMANEILIIGVGSAGVIAAGKMELPNSKKLFVDADFRFTVTPLSSKAIRQRTETLPEIKEDEI